MIVSYSALIKVLWVMSASVLAAILALYLSKYIRRAVFKRLRDYRTELTDMIVAGKGSALEDIEWRKPAVIRELVKMTQSIRLPEDMLEIIRIRLDRTAHQQKYLRDLRSRFPSRRANSLGFLGIIGGDQVAECLRIQFQKEKHLWLRLLIADQLIEMDADAELPVIVDSINDGPDWYSRKIGMILAQKGEEYYRLVRPLLSRTGSAAREFVLAFAELVQNSDLQNYLENIALADEAPERAASILEVSYPEILSAGQFADNRNPKLREAYARALAGVPSEEHLEQLKRMLGDIDIQRQIVSSMGSIVRRNPRLLPQVTLWFLQETDPGIRLGLAGVLAHKIEYLLRDIRGTHAPVTRKVIYELLLADRTSNLIGFLNRNRDIQVENDILEILVEAIRVKPGLTIPFSEYLNERMLKKLGLIKPDLEASRPRIPIKKGDRIILGFLLGLIIISMPLLYVLTFRPLLTGLTIHEHLSRFVAQYSYFFIIYSLGINSIYLVLLVFSLINLVKQTRYWNQLNYNYIFKPGIMPTISIVAPAHNEEKTIIDNVHSLLSLKYPVFDIVIVNDGSKDNTLNVLVNHFDLEKVDIILQDLISTAPVRGIYRCRQIPNLTIIDKENGGKADSLNAGINHSRADFLCCIDADSIIEPDALLKLMYQVVHSDIPVIAAGGNILPANGCRVEKGSVIQVRLSRNPVVRFQVVEYLRAFLAGRLGWAQMNSLLIISGAFGIFNLDMVRQIGGYLTGSGHYRTDTVGEDMELVVRLSEFARERGDRYRIIYGFNANCWTEVPSGLKNLYKQRDRWHRGLIEIMMFHKTSLYKRKLGRIGALSLPYFLYFEIIGPFYELAGYIVLLIGIIFKLLNPIIITAMFVSAILYGTIISISSLALAENDVLYYRDRETVAAILFSVIENFGYRQIVSAIRVFAYIHLLFKKRLKSGEWGAMVRTGFKP